MDIKLDKKNYRKHNEKNCALIESSLKTLGAGRSILIDNNNTVIAGNQTFKEAQKLNIPIKIIETNGSELIAVKRTDLAENDIRRRQLGIIDNLATDKSEFDIDAIEEDFMELNLSSFDVSFADFDSVNELLEEGAKEIDVDNLNVSECKIVFKFDAEMYESVLSRLNQIKQDLDLKTNEAILLKLLSYYGA